MFTQRWMRALTICCAAAAQLAVASDDVDYLSQIKPLLSTKCYSCHGAWNQKAELRLQTRSLMLAGGESGKAIVPGNANKSLLVERITAAEDARMPPADAGSRLTDTEVTLIRTWINQGAKAPEEPIPADPRSHWAFQKPVRPNIPQVDNVISSRNPIDHFLADSQRKLGLVPVGRAEKQDLLRRVYLDLIGLPPTREEQQAFLTDDLPDAYDRVVDQLLHQPGYGERWGRHWMDIWRYSDWYGLGAEVRDSQKHVWRWRDWIVQSLNEDKPYDRMILEMLAGDEIAPTDPDVLRATGYLARSYFLFNRTTWLDATVEHTSKAFLGLTLNCAKCHDHKFDPISQLEYYRMRAIFEPHQLRLDPVPGEVDLDRDGLARAFDADPDAPTYLHVRGNEKDADTSRMIEPGVPSALGLVEIRPVPVRLPPAGYSPGIQTFVLADHLALAEQAIGAARVAVGEAQQKLAQAERTAIAAPADAAALPVRSGNSSDVPLANSQPASDTPPLSPEAARLALAVAERTLAASELRPAALRAAHAADVAQAIGESAQSLKQQRLAAALAARKYELAQAEEALARAEHKLVDSAGQEQASAKQKKKRKPASTNADELSVARKKLEDARAALAAPGENYTSLYVSRRAANGLVDQASPRHGPYSPVSTGRRTALASWIASPENPLTPRVAVNHIWLRHFGQPLVESISDFGLRAPRPPQHALLDWLADEFTTHHYSMKHLHRLIVSSHTYQLRSSLLGADESTKRADPNNETYWRRKPLRMESQVVRDSLIYLAGELDTRLGGPTIDPAKEHAVFRRSLYFTHSRDDRAKFVSMFDDADILSCYRRRESIVPQQALALANSKLALSMARKIAARLADQPGDATDEQFIRAAFQAILATGPTAEELAACQDAVQRTVSTLRPGDPAKAGQRSRENLVHSLLNHNDFITIR